jgi:hypothetical protein
MSEILRVRLHYMFTNLQRFKCFQKNFFSLCFQNENIRKYEVARWPHGCRRQCSEVAVPALVGSNPTEGGGFFRRKEPPPGHGCVCMSIRG